MQLKPAKLTLEADQRLSYLPMAGSIMASPMFGLATHLDRGGSLNDLPTSHINQDLNTSHTIQLIHQLENLASILRKTLGDDD